MPVHQRQRRRQTVLRVAREHHHDVRLGRMVGLRVEEEVPHPDEPEREEDRDEPSADGGASAASTRILPARRDGALYHPPRGRPLHLRGSPRGHRLRVRRRRRDDARDRHLRARAGALRRRPPRARPARRRPRLPPGARRARARARGGARRPAHRPRPPPARRRGARSSTRSSCSPTCRRSSAPPTSTSRTSSSRSTASRRRRPGCPEAAAGRSRVPGPRQGAGGLRREPHLPGARPRGARLLPRLHDRAVDGAAGLPGHGVLDRRLLRPRRRLPERGAADDAPLHRRRVGQGDDDQGLGPDRVRGARRGDAAAARARPASSASARQTARTASPT